MQIPVVYGAERPAAQSTYGVATLCLASGCSPHMGLGLWRPMRRGNPSATPLAMLQAFCHACRSRPRCIGNRRRLGREWRAYRDEDIAALVAPLPLAFVMMLGAVRALAVLETRHVRHVQPVVHKTDRAADLLAAGQRDAVFLLAVHTGAPRPIAKAPTGAAEGAVVREVAFYHIVLVEPPAGAIVVIDRIWLGATWVGERTDIRPVGHHVIPLHHRVWLGAKGVCADHVVRVSVLCR